MDRAFFVIFPRVLKDLCKPHLIDAEKQYEVVRTVTLSAIAYENFITDMVADRQFIEDNADICAAGEPMKCILIRSRGKNEGVLVVPDSPDYKAYVKWAAYITNIE